jgi:hypothetical integral membrane protein (TIGR02206 family)
MDNKSKFLTYRTELPEGVIGFDHFGLKHTLFLIGIAAFMVLVAILYKRSGKAWRNGLRIAIAACIVLLELAKQIICAVRGVGDFDLLPLHLCGMSIFIITIHTIRPTKFTGEFIYCLSIPGAVSALLFSDWTMYNLWNFFCMQSFFIHMLEITYPVMLLTAGELRPKVKNLWMPLCYMIVAAFTLYHLNKALNTNFFFLNEAAPDSPLSLLKNLLGAPGYIFGTLGLLLIIWAVMYAPVLVLNRWRGLDFRRIRH